MPSPAERHDPDKAAHIAAMTAILKRKTSTDDARGGTSREAHPKTVGLLRGKFAIVADLPPELRVGVLKEAATSDCRVRSSH